MARAPAKFAAPQLTQNGRGSSGQVSRLAQIFEKVFPNTTGNVSRVASQSRPAEENFEVLLSHGRFSDLPVPSLRLAEPNSEELSELADEVMTLLRKRETTLAAGLRRASQTNVPTQTRISNLLGTDTSNWSIGRQQAALKELYRKSIADKAMSQMARIRRVP